MKRTLGTLILGIFIMVTMAGITHANDNGWIVRGFAAHVDPDIAYTDSADDGTPVSTFTDADIGFGIAAERKVSRHFGIELRILTAEPKLGLAAELDGQPITVTDTLGMTPIMLGVTYHFTPDSGIDLWVNAGLAHVSYSNLHYDPPVGDDLDFKVSENTGWSAALGADIFLGNGGWLLTAAVRHIDTRIEITEGSTGSVEFDADTFVGSVGFGYRF